MTSWIFGEAYRIAALIFKKRTRYEGNILNAQGFLGGADALVRLASSSDRQRQGRSRSTRLSRGNFLHCALRARPRTNASGAILGFTKLPISFKYAAP